MKLPSKPAPPAADWQLQLINIVFLLLLFFISNGSISNVRDVTIELPRTVATEGSGPVGEAAHLDADNKLRFQGAPATADSIARMWFAEGGTTPARSRRAPFQIVADRRLAAAALLARLQEFRAAGFENLGIVTLREFGDAP